MEAKYVAWRKKYLRSCSRGLYCWYNDQGTNGDAITCSEAHGYAMLISVLHRNQQDFDGLLKFFIRHKNNNGLMNWQIRQRANNGPVYVAEDGKDSATDGDLDIASALFQASKIFPAGSQMYPAGTYLNEANQLATNILNHVINPTLNVPFLGDWVNLDGTENIRLYNSTRTSDFMLSAFLLFSRYHKDPAQRARWVQVLNSVKQVAVRGGGPTGFLPDFMEYDAKAKSFVPAKGKLLETNHDGDLNWNACRTPWRLAHYLAATGDQSILPLLKKEHQTVKQNHVFNFPYIPAGINLPVPKALVDYSDKAFIAPIGYLCHVLGDQVGHHECIQALTYQDSSYFGDSIDVLIAEMASHIREWL